MSDAEIIFKVLPSGVGEITLNRPRALNALTLSMCQQLVQQLTDWQQNHAIKAVVIRGAGGRAFCAGGDVRALQALQDDPEQAMSFFREEYRMNLAIQRFTKPYIAVLDGITMGGGAGVSLHGSYRIATEKFSFAMPETRIGFFPDIGAAHFLQQCPGFTGTYLALTGNRITAADALALGLVDACVSSTQINELIQQPVEQIPKLIQSFEIGLDDSPLMRHKPSIDESFANDKVEALLLALEKQNTNWSRTVLQTLQQGSPTALKVTLAMLQKTRALNFEQILQMNFDMAYQFMLNPDFYEGVRAVLVDKDNAPQWQPNGLAQVSESMVAQYFEPYQRLCEPC